MIKYALALILLFPLLAISQEKPVQEKETPMDLDDPEMEYIEAEPEQEEEIYMQAEVMPEFPGGPEAMFKFIVMNVEYPTAALDAGITGKVYVKFVVTNTGEIDNIEVMRGIGGGCDEEAVRVIQKMPRWNPGIQRGKAVSVQYILPFNFQDK